MRTNQKRPVSDEPPPGPSRVKGSQAAVIAPETSGGVAATELLNYAPRERILGAALKLFVEQGYFNTNVPDLSRESKCSVGSIYHNFKNKEEVASALYAEGMHSFRRALEAAVRRVPEQPEQLIKALVRSFLEFSAVNVQLSRYMWLCRHNEFITGAVRYPTMVGFDPFGRLLTKTIKQGIRSKQIRVLRANVIWSILFGIPLAYVRDWLDGYNTVPPGQVADELAETCWRALRQG